MRDKIIESLKEVYDPDLSINVYDLGLIYEINEEANNHVDIIMTLTSAFCPAADDIVADVTRAVEDVDGVNTCKVELTFIPAFGPEMMTEEVRMSLGIWDE
jgi:metal-sulfur cluster biosynthetic enzyme